MNSQRRRSHSEFRLMSLESRIAPATMPNLSHLGPRSVEELQFATASAADLWQVHLKEPVAAAGVRSDIQVTRSVTASLDPEAFAARLVAAPKERAGVNPFVVSLPKPDGSYAQFNVWESSIMEPGLATQFPNFHTYRGQGIDDPSATLAADVTSLGFHASVLSTPGSWNIDPLWHLQTGEYMSYNRSDLLMPHGGGCNCALCQSAVEASIGKDQPKGGAGQSELFNGGTLRTYRLAVAATGEYTAYFGGTVANGQAAIVTAVNRVNQIYINDMAIQFTLVSNNSSLVYTDAKTDPYTSGNLSTMNSQNQANIDTVIGTNNYDVGHIFDGTDSGGLAQGLAGQAGAKALGCSTSATPIVDSFYLRVFAHELGHQFSATHTFNSSAAAFASQYVAATAVEPGSGSTIMSYGGGNGGGSDDFNGAVDPYFHIASIEQINNYTTNTIPSVGTTSSTGNFPPALGTPPLALIPLYTPFSLNFTASDPNGDALTYTIEERDLGPAQPLNGADNGSSPLFRSRPPSASSTRYFPQLSSLASNTPSNTEKLPTIARTMHFTGTARDNRAGGGGFHAGEMYVQAVNTGSPFQISSFNAASSWSIGTTQTITWDLGGTTGNGINTANVNISLSIDGGLTYPITLLNSTPNDGSQQITVPNVFTNTGRIKVHGINSLGYFTFFDINNANIAIGTINLVGKSMSAMTPTIYRPDQLVNFDFQVSNDGPTTVGEFQVGFYVSKNSTISTSDTFVGESFFPATPGNTTLTRSASFYLPRHYVTALWGNGDGTYYLGMIADYNNHIAESNESDNANLGDGIDRQAITVTQTADDQYELNNLTSTATVLAPGLALSNFKGLGIQHDLDFFKMTVPAQATELAHITVDVTYADATFLMSLGMYKPGAILPSVGAKELGGHLVIDYYGKAGDYIAQVGGGIFHQTGNPYDLIWTVGPDLREYVAINDADSGPGSLRQAILDANAVPGVNTVTLDPGFFSTPKTITLTSGEIEILDSISIVGPGAALATVSANNAGRIFNLQPAAKSTAVVIEGLSLTGGNVTGAGGAILVGDENLTLRNCDLTGNQATTYGGAVAFASNANFSQLVIEDSTVTGNTAGFDGGGIGGVFRYSAVAVRRSTIAGNSARNGGGISIPSYNTSFLLEDTTVSGNQSNLASGGGGGISLGGLNPINGVLIRNSTISENTTLGNGGGVLVQSSTNGITIQNSTITGNTAQGSKGGGGIAGTGFSHPYYGYYVGSKTSLESCIVSGNVSTANANDDLFNGSPDNNSVTAKYSGIGSFAGVSKYSADATTNSLLGADFILGPLAYNGGPTKSHALLAGSPAIDNGSNPASLTVDQRGGVFVRDFNGTDIGAFESQPSSAVASVLVNGGDEQRSRVTTIEVAFDNVVTLPSLPETAFSLTRQSDGLVVDLFAAVTNGATTSVTLTITGPNTDFDSLRDGRYTLRVLAGMVNGGNFDGNGDATPGDDYQLIGDPTTNKLFRLFGDIDGNGLIDLVDFGGFRSAFSPSYIAAFDFDNSGAVDLFDFGQFRSRFGMDV